jgi:hypothetical protein
VEASTFTGLDAAMIELNKNTLDVAERARGDRQTARLAEMIDRAGTNQAQAVSYLRATPVAAEGADKSERESLRLLKLARAEAKKLHDEAAQRDQDRKRRDLRQAYRERLEAQVALKGETDPYIGKAVERRDRMKLRGLGERQDAIRASLDELRTKTKELEDAGVFDLAHTRLSLATTTASKRLSAGQADHPVQRAQESAVSTLKALVQALDDSIEHNDEFRDDSGRRRWWEAAGRRGSSPSSRPWPSCGSSAPCSRRPRPHAYIDESKEPSAAEELASLGTLQHSLSERARGTHQEVQNPPEAPKPPGRD